MTTIGRDSDWANLPATNVVSSHRATTSSRHPGVVFEGSVKRGRTSLAQCPRCRGYLLLVGPSDSLDRPHSPYLASRGDGLVLVDCTGAEVRPAIEVSP